MITIVIQIPHLGLWSQNGMGYASKFSANQLGGSMRYIVWVLKVYGLSERWVIRESTVSRFIQRLVYEMKIGPGLAKPRLIISNQLLNDCTSRLSSCWPNSNNKLKQRMTNKQDGAAWLKSIQTSITTESISIRFPENYGDSQCIAQVFNTIVYHLSPVSSPFTPISSNLTTDAIIITNSNLFTTVPDALNLTCWQMHSLSFNGWSGSLISNLGPGTRFIYA